MEMRRELQDCAMKYEWNLDLNRRTFLNLFFILAASFFGAFGLGYAKFYGLGYLTEHVYTPEDEPWVIQIVSSLMTLGPILIYSVSGSITQAFKKQKVMFSAALLLTLVLIGGYHLNWKGSPWLYLFLVGLFMGAYGVAKIASVPLQAIETNGNIFKINAWLTIFFIVGILTGMPCGTAAYEYSPRIGAMIGITVFALSALFGLGIRFKKEELQPFRTCQSKLLENTVRIFFHYPLYLLASPLIWGIASAVGLAVKAYVQDNELGVLSFAQNMGLDNKVMSTFMLLYAAIGTIFGNLMTSLFQKHRYQTAFITSVLISLSIFSIPFIVDWGMDLGIDTSHLYFLIAFLMLIIGALFGLCTNIIDSEYLYKVGQESKEGPGVALQNLIVSSFTFLIGGIVGWSIYKNMIDIQTQFYLMSLISTLSILLILVLALKNGAMNKSLSKVLAFIARRLLRLRYDIRVKGFDQVPTKGGCLFLPNHPAEMDPVILCSELYKKRRPRPVVDETFYYMPGVHWVMKLMRSFGMADMQKGAGSWKQLRIKDTLNQVSETLEDGDSVVLYPAGRLMRSGSEALGAASGAHQLYQKAQKTEIVLVRSRGLWGSIFSTAYTPHRAPDLVQGFKRGLKAIVQNLFFFTPKRKVEIEFKKVTGEIPKDLNVSEFNTWLTQFYNEHAPEPLTRVPMSRWSSELIDLPEKEEETTDNLEGFDPAKVNEVLESLSKHLERPSLPHLNDRLAEDLGLDSLTQAECLVWLEEEYEVNDIEIQELEQVKDLVRAALEDKPKPLNKDYSPSVPEGWESFNRPGVEVPEAKTLPEAFLKSCDRMGEHAAMADDVSGVLSYQRAKLGTLLLSEAIKELPGERVGILLPASVAAGLSVLSTLCAGKVPVMLNWTVGRGPLEHAVEAAGIEAILTSESFLDKLKNVDFGKVREKFVFLEQIKKKDLGTGEKIMAWVTSNKPAEKIMGDLGLDRQSAEDPAVILFTSGSESLPKGVPLSHKNLLANMRSAVEVMKFDSEETLYGFLPPFHSFGLTITTLLPLLSGMKVAFHPNPTEQRRIASGCLKWGITSLCGTPTFIKGILKAATPEQRKSVRTYVTGAEKCPQELIDLVQSFGEDVRLLEGYGITECAPVLAMNRPDLEREGVGQPFPGVQLKIVDPETKQEVEQGARGLILARGENVFAGYLGTDKDPFIRENDVVWYNTGDLGYITESGSLVLSGRMKRFVKVAGEMISLPAMEEALGSRWPSGEEGPALAVEAVEIEGQKPKFWIFTCVELDIKEANEVLKEKGFSNVARLHQHVHLETLPLLGTGKTDYRSLKTIITDSHK